MKHLIPALMLLLCVIGCSQDLDEGASITPAPDSGEVSGEPEGEVCDACDEPLPDEPDLEEVVIDEPDMEEVCVPTTCAQEGAECGKLPSGCGDVLSCGTCGPARVCGGGGIDRQCGDRACTPRRCEGRCGEVGDGCGELIQCGACQYQNMVLDSNGDPGCLRHNGTYYLYQPRATDGKVVAFTSTDLVHWKARGEVFRNTTMRYDGQRPSALWAPEVFRYKGKFYLYFVNRMKTVGNNAIQNSDIAVVESDDPLDFNKGTAKVLLSDDYVFLDPSPFYDEKKDQLYLLFKRRTPSMSASEIRIRPMVTPTRMGGEASTLISGDDIARSRGIIEHPELEERDGVYFFLFSYGHGAYAESYTIAYRTSKSGPTRGYGPVRTLFAPNEHPKDGAPIRAPGASSIVQDGAGKDWLVYRQKTKAATGFGDRQVAIDRVYFRPDASPPVIRGTATRNVKLDAPTPLP